MLSFLPKSLQLVQDERVLEYNRLMKRLERALIENQLYRISHEVKFLKGFHSIHRFTQEEKEKLFALIIEFLLQKYVYGTKQFFRMTYTAKKLKFFLQGFVKKVSPNIQINFEDLKQIYDDINQNGLQTTFDNSEQQVKRGIQFWIEFQGLFRLLIPPSYFPQLIENSIQGEATNQSLYRVVKTEPLSTYQKSFEMLVEFKKTNAVRMQDSYLLSQMIVYRPDLPIDNYLDLLLEDYYNSFISLLLNHQVLANMKMQQMASMASMGNMGFSFITARQQEFIQPIVYLITPQRTKVWDMIERMMLVISDLMHPNNAQKSDFVFSFIYLFVKIFVERVESQNQNAEKKEESENTLENNIFGKDEQMFLQDEEINDIEEEEEEEDEDQNDKDKVFDKKEYELDEEAINRFITIIKPLLKYLFYQKDKYKLQVGGIFRSLCKLRPKEITPYVLEQIQLALERDDLKPLLILYIIEKIFKQSIQYDQYPQIINYIPFIIRQTTNFILENDGEYIWRFYDILFQYIPIYEIKDLKEQYQDVNLEEEMNIEGINLYQITQDISDFALEAFRKYLSTFEFTDFKHHNSQRSSEIMFSVRNKFYNFIFQSSKSNFKEIVNIVSNYLDDKILHNLNDNLVLLLQAIILRDPNVLGDILIIIQNQLLRKNKESFEFNISNITTIRNYLVILYEIIQYSGKVNKKYYKEIKVIIDLSLKHDEPKIQQTGQNIIYYLILSQAAIHVSDFYYSNDGQLQLDWLKLKSKSNQEKYSTKWQNLDDQEFIKQIMDDYYYPAYKAIFEIIEQKGEKKPYLQYLEEDFFHQFESQYQLDSTKVAQQLELKVRKSLSQNIEIIYSFYKPLYYRMKQSNNDCTQTFKLFQDQYCFQILDNMYEEATQFCTRFLPLYINYGLALDMRLAPAQYNILKLLMNDSSDKILRLGKWLSIKTRSSDTTKIKFHNRYQSQMFCTYVLNHRLDQMYHNNLNYSNNKELLLLPIPMLFDSNDINNRSNWLWFSTHLELIEDRNWIYNIFQKLYEQLKQIIKGKWFNQQHIETLNESEKQKLLLFQNHFLKGFANFVLSVSIGQPSLFLDSYQLFDSVYLNLIDRVNKADFNVEVLSLIQKISQACVKVNNSDTQRKKILIIKNQEVQQYIDSIFEERDKYLQSQYEQNNSELMELNLALNSFVQAWLNIPLDAANSRQLITNGCALFMMRTESLPQLNDQVIIKAFNCCISSEFNIRSFGRLLLYRLIQINIFQNKTIKYINRNLDEFKQDKFNIEQYKQFRFLLPEDQIIYKKNDQHKRGKIFLYTQLKYVDVNREAVRQKFQVLKQFTKDQWRQFINLMFIDLSVFDQSQQEQSLYMLFADKQNVANFFNDVDNIGNDQFFYNSYMQTHPKLSIFSKKIQFLKYLFVVSEFDLFEYTNDILDINNQDQQLFQKFYLSGLLNAIHSSWTCNKKQQIFDFCIEKIEKIIIDQSRDEFKTLNILLHAAVAGCDLRKQEDLLKLIVNKALSETDNKMLKWIVVFQMMIESKKYEKIEQLEQLVNLSTDFKNQKAVQQYIQIICDTQHAYPHNKELLSQFNLIEQFQQQVQILFDLKYFYFEKSEIFSKGLDFVVQQFNTQNVNIKLYIIESLYECWKSRKFQINQLKLSKILPIIEYLLTINEENNVQQLTSGLMIFQNIRLKECTQQLIDLTLNLLKTSQSTVRVRQLNFIKNLTKEILFINRAEILDNVSQYLLDDQKGVQQCCLELITQLIQSMTLQEINILLEKYLKLAQQKDTELIGKQILMAMVMAHPRCTQQWINQVLKVILEKQSKLQQQQKSFAANYLKLYRANQLMEIEENQVQIEWIEKMSELSNPYNYFA